MHVHRAVISGVLIAPHHVEQVLPGVHRPGLRSNSSIRSNSLAVGSTLLPSFQAASTSRVMGHGCRPPPPASGPPCSRPAQPGPHPGLQPRMLKGL